MTTAYPVMNLGQAPPRIETLEISREFADTVRVSILRLIEAPNDNPDVTLEQCWRDLTVLKKPEVQDLLTRMTVFLDSTAEVMLLNRVQYALLEEVFHCVETIVEEQAAGKGESLETVATIVGIAGGLAALVAVVA